MYCRNCGQDVDDKAEICVKCGVRPLNAKNYCQECGVETTENQELCIKCGNLLKSLESTQNLYRKTVRTTNKILHRIAKIGIWFSILVFAINGYKFCSQYQAAFQSPYFNEGMMDEIIADSDYLKNIGIGFIILIVSKIITDKTKYENSGSKKDG